MNQLKSLARRRVEDMGWKPRNCVWELTLACNLRCLHCGTRAGKKRRDELRTAECLSVVSQLADLGCELITLSGGEPTLRKDWDVIAGAISRRGMYVNMVSNGFYRSDEAAREVARRALDAGLCNIGVSIDGPEELHDAVRGEGAWRRSMSAIGHFVEAGVPVAALTTVNRLNLPRIAQMRQMILDSGAAQWRFQLAKPMGAMDEQRALVLEPRQLLELIPLLARLKKAGGVSVHVGDSIGYYGPYDHTLRGHGWRGRKECWKGCQAGMQGVGIEADGAVKACLSLQAKWGEGDPFVEGHLREETLDEIWHRPGIFAFNRDFRVESLTGPCRGCRYDTLCRGGARCVSSAFAGTLTEDSHCYHGVALRETKRRGARIGQPAVAAAALALSLGAAGCYRSHARGPEAELDAAAIDRDAALPPITSPLPDGSTPADGALGPADSATDAPRDAAAEVGPVECAEVACDSDYGVVPPGRWEECCEPSVHPDYGDPPVLGSDGGDPADAGAIDPCAAACCECDYGEPPPPECCEPAVAGDYGVGP